MNEADSSSTNEVAEVATKEGLFVRLRAKVTLPIALVILVFLALVIVSAGFSLYWNDSNRKYDIARGNEDSKNQALSVEDGTTDRTSPVDEAAIKQKLDFLEKENKALSGMGNFEPGDVNNENLQIVTPEQPSF